jgi:DNA-binding response OmpR family regulator
MSDRMKALVVEDDSKIREEIEDVLSALGHDHDWAESQQEARELLEKNDYHYVLADLEIPARPGRGFAKIEYGRKFVEQVPQIKGRGRVPVVIMTGHHKDGLNLAMELLGNGAMDFVCKPFGDAASGRSLSQVIQGVLEKHRHAFPAGTLPADPPKEFRGGTLSFHDAHIELNGEIIFESDSPGHSWLIMHVLRTPRASGKLPNLSAPKLASAVDPTGQLTEGAVASCIHDMRVRICNAMLEKANVVVGREGVIANKNKGYHLAAWLKIENRDGAAARKIDAGPTQGHDPAMAPRQTSNGPASPTDGPASERQLWILAQLQNGVRVERQMVQKQFGISEKQAKRELGGLSSRGLVGFIRKPRPGYYVLLKKPVRA